MKARIETTAQRQAGGWGVGAWLYVDDRMWRVWASWGTPPGSHIGLWRTRAGEVSGWNLRVGRRIVGPCLTLLAHRRRRTLSSRVG